MTAVTVKKEISMMRAMMILTTMITTGINLGLRNDTFHSFNKEEEVRTITIFTTTIAVTTITITTITAITITDADDLHVGET